MLPSVRCWENVQVQAGSPTTVGEDELCEKAGKVGIAIFCPLVGVLLAVTVVDVWSRPVSARKVSMALNDRSLVCFDPCGFFLGSAGFSKILIRAVSSLVPQEYFQIHLVFT